MLNFIYHKRQSKGSGVSVPKPTAKKEPVSPKNYIGPQTNGSMDYFHTMNLILKN